MNPWQWVCTLICLKPCLRVRAQHILWPALAHTRHQHTAQRCDLHGINVKGSIRLVLSTTPPLGWNSTRYACITRVRTHSCVLTCLLAAPSVVYCCVATPLLAPPVHCVPVLPAPHHPKHTLTCSHMSSSCTVSVVLPPGRPYLSSQQYVTRGGGSSASWLARESIAPSLCSEPVSSSSNKALFSQCIPAVRSRSISPMLASAANSLLHR